MRRLAVLSAFALALFSAPPAGASAKASYGHYMKALLLQREGRYDDALREYQAAITIDPDSTFVLQQAAELALDIGQAELASEFAESFARKDPTNPKAFHLLGNVRWSQGNLKGAREAYLKALSLDPEFGDALYSMGNLLSATEPEKAKDYFLKFLKLNPSSEADIDYQIAQLEHRMGKEQAAIQRLKSAISSEPSFLQARYSLAQVFELMKSTDEAYAEYLEILPLDPQNVGLLVRLGEMTSEKGDRDKAEEYFSKAVAVEPANAAARFWLALMAEQRGDFNGAADQISKSAALNEDPALNLRLSYYLTQASRLKDAVASLERARARWPNDPDIAYFLGLGYDDIGLTDKGVVVMQDAVRLKPDSHEARFQLGAMLEKLNRMEEAEKTFRALLDLKPDDPVTLNYLGYSLADRGLKLAEAEKLIQKALALDPENGAYLDSLGWVHHKQGRDDAAAADIAKALEKMPYDDTVWDHFGDVQAGLGRTGEAWLAWMTSAEHGGPQPKLEPKLRKAADKLSSEELGALYLKLLSRTHDELPAVNALGRVSVRAGDSSFSFTALLQYDRAAARLRLDVLNPFWLPIYRLEYSSGTVDLGGMEAAGVPNDVFQRAAGSVLELLYGYFHGDELAASDARFKKGWIRSWVETKAWTLFLAKSWPPRLASAQPKKDRHQRLEVEGFKEFDGRMLPMKLRAKGSGFAVEIELKKAALPAVSSVEPPVDGPPPAAKP